MSNTELIAQEIRRRITALQGKIPDGASVVYNTFSKDEASSLGKYTELENLLLFIGRLPKETSITGTVEKGLLGNNVMIPVLRGKARMAAFNKEIADTYEVVDKIQITLTKM